ncbi:MAG: putative LPS assembly protein LptD [Candidatus Latescibacterota bacterium]
MPPWSQPSLAGLLLLPALLAAQAPGPVRPPDPAVPAPADTAVRAPADSGLAAARALLEPSRGSDRGFEYTADLVIYSLTGDSILLRGAPARVTHGEARLEAAEIVYLKDRRLVVARGRSDSTGALTGQPVLRRGAEELHGSRIVYDLEDEQGTIVEGRIKRERGYYAGAGIRTVSDEEFHVRRGSYTTCDYERPHFDFFSPRIKVIMDDMAIARPVYLRVKGKRLFWIPFYIFSLRQDRQSGILTPSFGRRPLYFGSGSAEWEVRNLGYYFAPNQYWDLQLAGDLRQRSGWLARADLAYALRYRWSGALQAQLENRQQGSSTERGWRVDLRHSQEVSATTQLRASGTFQSNRSFSRDNSVDLRERLNRTLRSNLTLSKRWPGSGNSLSLLASQTRNLDTQTFETVLPEVAFRKDRKPLLGGAQGRALGEGASGPWYSRVYYDGSARLRNTRRGTRSDTTARAGADVSLRLSSQHKPLSYLQLSPSLSESWQDADLGNSGGGSRGLRTDRLSASASLTQTFYGLFQPRLWRITALRHVLKPGLSLSYQAARADTGGLLGIGGRGSPWQQQRRLSLQVDNTFWAKVLRGEEEAKVRLAQLILATGYDFDRRQQPVEDLTASLSVAAGGSLDTRLSTRSEFYDQAGRRHLLSPRLTQFEVRTGLRWASQGGAAQRDSLAGQGPAGQSLLGSPVPGLSPLDASFPGQSTAFGDPYAGSQRFGYESGLRDDIRGRQRGTSLQLSHYYSRTRSLSRTTTRHWLRAATGFTLGRTQHAGYALPRWHFDYSLSYTLSQPGEPLLSADRVTGELLSVQREFHDWTATLNFRPTRLHRDLAFYFKVQLKDIPQIRFERGDVGM